MRSQRPPLMIRARIPDGSRFHAAIPGARAWVYNSFCDVFFFLWREAGRPTVLFLWREAGKPAARLVEFWTLSCNMNSLPTAMGGHRGGLLLPFIQRRPRQRHRSVRAAFCR